MSEDDQNRSARVKDADRVYELLKGLLPTQFSQMLLAFPEARALIPEQEAGPAKRAMGLLEWTISPAGPGLEVLQRRIAAVTTPNASENHIASTIAEIDARLGKIARAGRPDVPAVVDVVTYVISVGAPLYDGGDRLGCAKLYSYLVAKFLPLLGGETPRPVVPLTGRRGMGGAEEPTRRGMGGGEDIAPIVRPRVVIDAPTGAMMAILKEFRGSHAYAIQHAKEPADVAWTIRDSFDRLRVLARGMAVCADLDGDYADGVMLARTASDLLRFMDEICDRCGVDSDVDYDQGLRTCAALGVFACRAVEQALGSEPSERLRRRFKRVVKDEFQAASPERVIWSCRHFLRTLLMKQKS